MAGQRRPDHTERWLLAFVAGLLLVTWPGQTYPGDPKMFREETRALILHGRLNVDSQLADRQGESGQFFVKNSRNGGWYSKYGLMNGVASLPPLLVERLLNGSLPPADGLHRLLLLNLYNLLLGLLIAHCLYVIVAEYVSTEWIRVGFVLSCLFGTFAWNYLRAQSSEIFQLVFMLGFFRAHQISERHPERTLPRVAAWLALAALTLTRLSYVLLVPIYAVATLMRRGPIVGRLLWAGAPALAIAGLVAAVNTVKFGSPFLTGYEQWHPEWHALIGSPLDGIVGFLVHRQRSIFTHFPVLIFALLGWPGFLRRHTTDALLIGVIFVVFLVALGLLPSWQGSWSYGPRYLLFILPLLSLPLATWLAEGVGRKVTLVLLLPVLVWSVGMQWMVNRYEFFTWYELEGYVDEPKYAVSQAYFHNRTFGRVNWELSQVGTNYDALPYLREFKDWPNQKPGEIRRYEWTIRNIAETPNLYWWR